MPTQLNGKLAGWLIGILTTITLATSAWFLTGAQAKIDRIYNTAAESTTRIGVLEQRATEADRRFDEILFELRAINTTLRGMRSAR